MMDTKRVVETVLTGLLIFVVFRFGYVTGRRVTTAELQEMIYMGGKVAMVEQRLAKQEKDLTALRLGVEANFSYVYSVFQAVFGPPAPKQQAGKPGRADRA